MAPPGKCTDKQTGENPPKVTDHGAAFASWLAKSQASSPHSVAIERLYRPQPAALSPNAYSLPASLPELSGAERNLGSRLPRSRLAGAGWNDGNFKVAPAPATAWPALSTNKNVIRALGRPTICRPPSVSGSYPV